MVMDLVQPEFKMKQMWKSYVIVWKYYSVIIYIIRWLSKERFIILHHKIILGLATVMGVFSFSAISANASTYTVKSGDTVSAIAQKFNTSTSKITSDNDLSNPDVISIGETLNINNSTKTATASSYEQPQAVTTQKTYSYQKPQTVQNTQPNKSYTDPANTSQTDASSAAKMMEQGTGVSASEWQKIINRESGGSTTAANPSGAYGLFQSQHNPGSTVQSQVADAIRVYKSQGLGAWQATAY